MGDIILQRAFGGLADVALWNANIPLGNVSNSAARRHLLSILKTTPHLLPKARLNALKDALVSLEAGLPTPDLFQPSPRREETLAGRRSAIVLLIETFSTSANIRQRLIEAAATKTKQQPRTIKKWIRTQNEVDPEMMAAVRRAAPRVLRDQPTRHPKALPGNFESLLDEAVAAWSAAGGAGRSSEG